MGSLLYLFILLAMIHFSILIHVFKLFLLLTTIGKGNFSIDCNNIQTKASLLLITTVNLSI